MKPRFPTALLLTLALTSSLLLIQDARTTPNHLQATPPVPRAFVQVTSVTLEPSTIHKTQSPNTTTVIAQILLRGEAPPNPEAVVEVGTASSDPPNNELKYENATRTVSLQKGVTVAKFKAETTARTLQGKLKVTVTLGGATKGIEIKDSEPKDYIAELTVLDP